MSIKIKERLKRLQIETSHEDRILIDRAVTNITGKNCEEGVDQIPDKTFITIAIAAKKRKKIEVAA